MFFQKYLEIFEIFVRKTTPGGGSEIKDTPNDRKPRNISSQLNLKITHRRIFSIFPRNLSGRVLQIETILKGFMVTQLCTYPGKNTNRSQMSPHLF